MPAGRSVCRSSSLLWGPCLFPFSLFPFPFSLFLCSRLFFRSASRHLAPCILYRDFFGCPSTTSAALDGRARRPFHPGQASHGSPGGKLPIGSASNSHMRRFSNFTILRRLLFSIFVPFFILFFAIFPFCYFLPINLRYFSQYQSNYCYHFLDIFF